jgi:hypothetical protein
MPRNMSEYLPYGVAAAAVAGGAAYMLFGGARAPKGTDVCSVGAGEFLLGASYL